ncbi:argininosuccinate lyase ArgH [Gottschalkia acidurici 9a]|uniref:Argininosuccinate lyase n=1 Tax=Gottschalkia acidurici (strain ATCC 7906 / DSM 604 / BCRC 14475 / CIP 104303 / KCTC 5404 / NCIMB 10678 / 9a) TaxID=1128398 RepID=K0AYB4_GOTA9|nr:argininosuccinate lyase [Gottschalkia acidurici]AFS77762.1 argininosuccinate lyase ArgH [Gottschalkia acidurici 9a]
MKLWGGRFQKEENKLMEDFNSSLPFDKRLYKQDITGSIAHVQMLAKSGILTEVEKEQIMSGLETILKDIEEGKLLIEGSEDIHTFVESNLIQRIGDVGKKLHTSRSRNDQVALDMRMFAKENGQMVADMLEDLGETIKRLGEENNYLMPGYTHLQRAQVVTFKHHMMAYNSMFGRDKKRLLNCLDILDESPLGCGALAGTTHSIDRAYTAEKLGFKKPVDNFMDGVSDRDYLLEMLSSFSIIMMHLSRLSEELIIWSSQEFRFVQIDDAYATGSSIMPQKKNPDAAELIRGKTGRVYGALMGMLTTMKGIPLAYNKDMQEDKQQFFDALDTVTACLSIMNEMLKTLKVNKDVLRSAVKAGFLNATEVADYLVNKGVAFRDAHKIVGEIVILCESKGVAIEDLSLEELNGVDPNFTEDIYDFIDYDQVFNKGIKRELL